ASANYQFNKELSLMVRAGLDFYVEDRAQERPYDAGSKLPQGSFRTQAMFSQESIMDFLLKYDKKINEDFSLTATVGGSTMKNEYKREAFSADGLTYPDDYRLANNLYGVATNQRFVNYATNSVYGLLTGSYKDFLFLDVTGRSDWNSTMATPVNPDKSLGLFYPSVNGSFILSEVVDLPTGFNFAKFRASYSEVGNGGQEAYMLQQLYQQANSLIPGSQQASTMLKNPELEPLRTRSIEFGTDLRFFKNKVMLDVAVYKSNTYNQHLTRVIDAASGYRTFKTNLGEVSNQGLEISLNTKQFEKKDGFNWSSMITYSNNRNQIVDLPDSTFIMQSRSVGSGQIVAK